MKGSKCLKVLNATQTPTHEELRVCNRIQISTRNDALKQYTNTQVPLNQNLAVPAHSRDEGWPEDESIQEMSSRQMPSRQYAIFGNRIRKSNSTLAQPVVANHGNRI
jgi:hypothetical protein